METIESADSALKPKNFFSQIASVAGYIEAASESEGGLKTDFITLKRFNPQAEKLSGPEFTALVQMFIYAGVPYEKFSSETFWRWAFIAHGIALTGHSEFGRTADEAREKLGTQLSRAGVSMARLHRLLNARGRAFLQTLSHVLRMMQSKRVKANWVELAVLVLREGTNDRRQKEREEKARINLVTAFVRAESAQTKKS